MLMTPVSARHFCQFLLLAVVLAGCGEPQLSPYVQELVSKYWALTKKPFVFNPEECADPQDRRLYVRLGSGHAFVLEYHPRFYTLGDFDPPLTPPLNPEAGEGCRENPAQLRPMFGPSLLPNSEAWQAELKSLGISVPDPGVMLIGDGGGDTFWRGYRNRFETNCTPGKPLVQVTPELKGCVIPTEFPWEGKDDWPIYLTTEGSGYLTPKGQPLYISCVSRVHPPRQCAFGYDFEPGLSLWVHSVPVTEVPLDKLIALDKALRARFSAYRVPELDVVVPRERKD
ncbi:hypothetical protein [Pannonibacter sp.]|uniref:hypothetical protein n=1 Tax=Pannonibacter sp. TaxID=1906786 RepID=UPI003F723222